MTNEYRETVENYFDDKDVAEDEVWQHVYKLLWDKHDRIKKSTSSRTLTVENIPSIKEKSTIESFKWMKRAERARDYLQETIGDAYEDEFDIIYRQLQGDRQNTRGNGFEHTISFLIKKYCDVQPMREPKLTDQKRPMKGYELVKDVPADTIDIGIFSPAEFRMAISTKWTLRRDRLKQYIFEARYIRERTAQLNTTVLTNDCDPNFLTTLIDSPSIDRVYHVHKQILLEIMQPLDGEPHKVRDIALDESQSVRKEVYRYFKLDQHLYDLTDLFKDIRQMDENR